MILSKANVKVVQPDTVLDLTAGEYEGKDFTVAYIIAIDGVEIDVCARTKGNTAGDPIDHAANFIYSTDNVNSSKVVASILPGPFDIVRVPAGAKAVRCILQKGV